MHDISFKEAGNVKIYCRLPQCNFWNFGGVSIEFGAVGVSDFKLKDHQFVDSIARPIV